MVGKNNAVRHCINQCHSVVIEQFLGHLTVRKIRTVNFDFGFMVLR